MNTNSATSSHKPGVTAGVANTFSKYGLRLKTRQGALVENLALYARDEQDAVQRIQRMYPYCDVLECRPLSAPPMPGGASFEDVIHLVTKAA